MGLNIILTQQLFLKGIAFVYLFAFASWLVQIASLYGKDGLLPLNIWMIRIQKPNIFHFIQETPSILIFSPQINKYLIKILPFLQEFNQYDNVFHVLCILGMLLSACIIMDRKFNYFGGFISYFLLYIMYLSIYSVGQQFASFQWDILLLETGYLTIFFSISKDSGKIIIDEIISVAREMFRWLAFRLYFSSGILKLMSNCPTWWDLSALNHHFQSQCIPHVLSWYFHQIPDFYKRFMVAGNFVCLIGGSMMFYAPFKSVQYLGILLNILMQINIILSGNYNFFNILAILLTISMLEDDILEYFLPNFIRRILGLQLKSNNQIDSIYNQYNPATKSSASILSTILTLFSYIILISTIFYFFFPFDAIVKGELPFNIAFVKKYFVDGYIPIIYLALTILFTIYSLGQQAIYKKNSKNCSTLNIRSNLKRIMALIFAGSYIVFSTYIFYMGLGKKIPVQYQQNQYLLGIQEIYKNIHNLGIANSYGLFRRMTGTRGREELVFQGSHDGKNYKTYEFYYKPSDNLAEPPQFCMPHQPRIDWQLWFSAMHSQMDEPYMFTMLMKMFQNSEIFMKQQIKYNPFADKPPKYLQINKYTDYKFTNQTEFNKTGQYWKRGKPEIFQYPLLKHDPDYLQQFRRMGIEITNKKEPINPLADLPVRNIVLTFIFVLIFI